MQRPLRTRHHTETFRSDCEAPAQCGPARDLPPPDREHGPAERPRLHLLTRMRSLVFVRAIRSLDGGCGGSVVLRATAEDHHHQDQSVGEQFTHQALLQLPVPFLSSFFRSGYPCFSRSQRRISDCHC